MLGCELGTPVDVGLILGWLEGADEIEGFSDGIDDGCADTLGLADGADEGTPVEVGPMLG